MCTVTVLHSVMYSSWCTMTLQFIQKLRTLLQTAQHALSSEDVNTIFFKITNLHLMHKEFVCDLESALSDDHTACDVVIGPAFHKLVSISQLPVTCNVENN